MKPINYERIIRERRFKILLINKEDMLSVLMSNGKFSKSQIHLKIDLPIDYWIRNVYYDNIRDLFSFVIGSESFPQTVKGAYFFDLDFSWYISNEVKGDTKMKKVIVYGASDDLIEIEGDIREEFSCYDEEHPQYLAFSEGTVLSIFYSDKGLWEIRRVAIGDAKYSKKEAIDNSEENEYSDIATLESDNIKWVVFGSGFAYSNPTD